jgi:hypothetical protein
VRAVLGPTNTGKTHLAIERMCGHSSGMMGFPLRLLAREVYDRVRAIKGDKQVALITGEERIEPPEARYFLCTAEAMPRTVGEHAFVAIDEAQLGADPERGHIFTDRLLHARGREETMILGSATLEPMVRALIPKAEITTRPRFSTLSHAGVCKLSRLPKRSAVVAFSVEQVYAMAEYLGVKVATGSQILSVKTWAHLPLPDGYVEWRASRTVKAQESDAGAEDSLLNALVHRLDALCAEVAERPRKLEDSETLLTREELILVTREAGTAAVETEILPRVMLLAQAHVRVWGWFYPSDERGLAEAIRVVRAAGGADAALSSRSHAGTSFLHDRFHSFWDVAEGPATAFEKPALLRNALRYRLGLNNSKDYTYKLSTGEVVRTRETFDINLKNIRRGFVVQRQTASFFKPSVACSLYRKWITDTDAPTVWDPSCGFGARLLGFASAFPRGEYLGNEPATKTHHDVAALAEELCLAGELAGASVIRAGSEVETPFGPETLDLVFTSPPYFDLERYYDEPGQCWRDYPTERAWYENYLLPTVAAAFVGLKAGCRMVLNVDARRKPLALRAAEEVGFLLEQEDMLVLGADHFTRKREGGVERGEPVLVFRKQ